MDKNTDLNNMNMEELRELYIFELQKIQDLSKKGFKAVPPLLLPVFFKKLDRYVEFNKANGDNILTDKNLLIKAINLLLSL